MALHDAETLRVGREGIARIRAQLAAAQPATAPVPEPPAQPSPDLPHDAVADDEPSIDRMRFDVALASEREQLPAAI
ncbi:MAG: hypothetical protein ACI9N0_000511 [Ilumatobacter sp.]|jgi:hypothetical protein